jgi:hypothetical protein
VQAYDEYLALIMLLSPLFGAWQRDAGMLTFATLASSLILLFIAPNGYECGVCVAVVLGG